MFMFAALALMMPRLLALEPRPIKVGKFVVFIEDNHPTRSGRGGRRNRKRKRQREARLQRAYQQAKKAGCCCPWEWWAENRRCRRSPEMCIPY